MGGGASQELDLNASGTMDREESFDEVQTPECCFVRDFRSRFSRKLKPLKPNFRQTLPLLSTGLRLARYCMQERRAGRVPLFDPFHDWTHTTEGGVPCGGLGCGSIGRGWRGFFNRWGVGHGLPSGLVIRQTVAADAFHVWCRPKTASGGCSSSAVCLLPPLRRRGKLRIGCRNELSAWHRLRSDAKAVYHGLFPRAWTVYHDPCPGVRGLIITCTQMSPVIPHNYEVSSFPVCVFTWDVQNVSTEAMDVSLMFSFQNGVTPKLAKRGGHHNTWITNEMLDAILLTHREHTNATGGHCDPLSFLIGLEKNPRVRMSFCSRFVTSKSGADLWEPFSKEGRLTSVVNPAPSGSGEAIGAALCASFEIPAQCKQQVRFVLSWDHPVARFGHGAAYKRRYTQFVNPPPSIAALELATIALQSHTEWTDEIEKWQDPIIKNPSLPSWYKTALFNELYFMVEGGTVWTASARDPTLPLFNPHPVAPPFPSSPASPHHTQQFTYQDPVKGPTPASSTPSTLTHTLPPLHPRGCASTVPSRPVPCAGPLVS
eukprot:RCo008345